MSLDRRGELSARPPHRLDLTASPSANNSLSRGSDSEERAVGGSYDLGTGEQAHYQNASVTGGGGDATAAASASNNNDNNGNGGHGLPTGRAMSKSAHSNGNISSSASNTGTLDSQNGDSRRRVSVGITLILLGQHNKDIAGDSNTFLIPH